MSDRKGIMYRILPFNGIWNNRNVSEVVNGIMNGKINATGEIEMNASEQELLDERIAPTSVILFTEYNCSTDSLLTIFSMALNAASTGPPPLDSLSKHFLFFSSTTIE